MKTPISKTKQFVDVRLGLFLSTSPLFHANWLRYLHFAIPSTNRLSTTEGKEVVQGIVYHWKIALK